MRTPRAPSVGNLSQHQPPQLGDQPGCKSFSEAQFPVYYIGCDNHFPGTPPPPGPPPPGCPAAATESITASITVPPEPEIIGPGDGQVLYFGLRVSNLSPASKGGTFISAAINWNNNCSGPKWTADSCAGNLYCDHFSPAPLDVSPGDVVAASITRTATGYTGSVSVGSRHSTVTFDMPTAGAKPGLAFQHDYLDPRPPGHLADCAELPAGPMIISELAISPMPGTDAQPVFASGATTLGMFQVCKWTQTPDLNLPYDPPPPWPADPWANRTLILNPPRKPPGPPSPPPPPPPPPPQPPAYECTSWNPPCQPCPPTTPNATTLAKCQATCGPPPPPPPLPTKYACDSSTHTCSPSPTGTFASKATCELDC